MQAVLSASVGSSVAALLQMGSDAATMLISPS